MKIMNKILKIFLVIIFILAIIILMNIPKNGTNFASIFFTRNIIETGFQAGDLKYCFQGYTFENNRCVRVSDSYFNDFKQGDFVDIANLNKFIGQRVITHGYVKSIMDIGEKQYIVFCDDYPNQCLISEILKNTLDTDYYYKNKNIELGGIVMKINNQEFKNVLFLYQLSPYNVRVFNKNKNIFEDMGICECEPWHDIVDPTTPKAKQARNCHPSRCSSEIRFK